MDTSRPVCDGGVHVLGVEGYVADGKERGLRLQGPPWLSADVQSGISEGLALLRKSGRVDV